MQNMQFGSGVGTVVGTDQSEGGIVEHLHPRGSEAGQALTVAVVALVILLLTIGRAGTGWRKAIIVGEFVLIVAAASAVSQYAVRTFVLLHPDAPGAAGLSIAL